MKQRMRWVAKALLLVGLVSGTAALVMYPQPGHAAQPNSLLTAGRDRLAVCVQPLSGAISPDEARAPVEAVLPAALQHPWWVADGLAAPVVETNCAPTATPFLLQPGATSILGKPSGNFNSLDVTQPARFRLFVFVLPQTQIRAIFGDSPYRVAPQEFLCREHQCSEVTTGIYVSPEELRDAAFLKLALQRGLGLERPVPEGRVDPSLPRGR
ncbi:MAG TPA: hypothetical protein VLA19_19375 [Herpetosiphonaceae bacterium]|nr:hypothetical protein [Herpetosiphonaceae bacterium]